MMQAMTCEDSNRPNGGEHCWKKDWKLSIVVPMMSFPVSYRFALLYGETADHLSLWERGENRTITVSSLGTSSSQTSTVGGAKGEHRRSSSRDDGSGAVRLFSTLFGFYPLLSLP